MLLGDCILKLVVVKYLYIFLIWFWVKDIYRDKIIINVIYVFGIKNNVNLLKILIYYVWSKLNKDIINIFFLF